MDCAKHISELVKLIDNFLTDESNNTNIATHYCSLDAGLSILEKKVLRMTHHRYMNDPSEVGFGTNVIMDLVINSKLPQEVISAFCERVAPKYTMENYNIILSCFMDHQDYLPGWRYYGHDGSGIGINFRKNNFPQPNNLKRIVAYNVIYEADKQKELVEDRLIKYINSISDLNNHQLLSLLTLVSFLVLPIIKNPDYIDEKEWRVFSYHIHMLKLDEYIFSPLPSAALVLDCVKPTYEYLSFNYSDIESIHTGPNTDHLLFKQKLQYILNNNGVDIDSINVLKSKKQYRT